MPQRQLPVFPVGTVHINSQVGFQRQDDKVVYYNGHLPVFIHAADDITAFRFITSQLVATGTATQGEITRAFNVPLTTVKRYSAKLRKDGVAGFFRPAAKRQGHKLTPQRLEEIQRLLDGGGSIPEISSQAGVLGTTIHKALKSGRLKKNLLSPEPSRRRPAARASAV